MQNVRICCFSVSFHLLNCYKLFWRCHLQLWELVISICYYFQHLSNETHTECQKHPLCFVVLWIDCLVCRSISVPYAYQCCAFIGCDAVMTSSEENDMKKSSGGKARVKLYPWKSGHISFNTLFYLPKLNTGYFMHLKGPAKDSFSEPTHWMRLMSF